MPAGFAIFLGLIVVYGAVAVVGRFSITMPIIFVAVGAILGPQGWVTARDAELLTEMTLALLLFADASTLDFRQVRDDARLPGRLLLIAMPLVIALGGLVAYGLFPGKAWVCAAASDHPGAHHAALGLPIFNNPKVPVRIRRALNVESGLNDGIATPLVALFTAWPWPKKPSRRVAGCFRPWAKSASGWRWGCGRSARRLALCRGSQARLDPTTGEQIGNLALALTAFWAAKALGGNGFVAAFVGGILFGYATRERLHVATEFTETSGTLLSLLVWAVFGANLVPPCYNPLTR